MDIDIRPVTEAEDTAYFDATERAFGHRFPADELELARSITERDRTLAAFDGPDIVGTGGAFSLALTVPGGSELPMAGITSVGVLPSHRRRGVLTELMRRQLEDVRDRGEPLAGLWASEGAIYGRFGYGLACFDGRFEAERDRTVFPEAPPDPGRIALVEKDAALPAMRQVYDRLWPTRPGMLSRPDRVWTMHYADLEKWREGASAIFYALHETGGAVDGYATYRVKSDWSDGLPGGTVLVREVLAEGPDTYAALWRFLFGIDLIRTIDAWGRPPDEPLLHLVVEPRRLRFRLTDALYLRILDVPAALRARTYGAAGHLVLQVRDGFGGFGEGRFELEIGPDGSACTPTDAEPDLSMDVRDLAAIYLGGVAPRTLAAAGRISEERAGVLTTAGAMFGADPGPWCPYLF
jgi:predicted acetyltransferase